MRDNGSYGKENVEILEGRWEDFLQPDGKEDIPDDSV